MKCTALLSALAILIGQFFYAGAMRPVFAFPSYLIVGLLGVLSIFPLRSKEEMQWGLGPMLSAFLLALWMGVESWASSDLWLGSTYLHLTLAALTLYLLMAMAVATPSARRLFAHTLLAGACVQSLLSIGQYAFELPHVPQGWFSEQLRIWYEGRGSERVSGTYLNANHLCWFSNAATLLALALGLFGRTPLFRKGSYLLLAFLFASTSLLTQSRGGLIALGVGVSFLLIAGCAPLLFARKWKKGAVVSFLFAMGLGGLAAFYFYSGQSFDRLELKDSYRLQVWSVAFQKIQEEPLFGGGPGSFRYYSRAFRQGDQATEDYYAHNDWLQIAGDCGLPALILLLGVVTSHCQAGTLRAFALLQEKHGESTTGALTLGATAAVVAFAVHSFFDFNLQLPANALLAASLLGMLAAVKKRSPKAPGAKGKIRILPFVLAGTSGLLLLSLFSHRSEWVWLQAENALAKGALREAYILAVTGEAAAGAHPKLYRVQAEALLKRLKEEPSQAPLFLSNAHDAIRRSIALGPHDRANYLRLTEILLLAGRWEEAREAAFKMIELAPSQANGYELAGKSFELQGDLKNAEWFYTLSTQRWNPRDGRKRLEEVQKRLNPAKE